MRVLLTRTRVGRRSVRVAFYGGRHFNNVHKLYEAFHMLWQGQGMVEIVTTDEPGGPTIVAELARANSVHIEVVPASWRVHGKDAEGYRRVILLQSEPDLVVLLPGGEVDEMAPLCEAADIAVWDLSSVPSIVLGAGAQLGEDEMPEEDQLF